MLFRSSENGTVTVEGAEGVALAVVELLRTQGVAPERLRVASGSLDAAYLDLTETITAMEALR